MTGEESPWCLFNDCGNCGTILLDYIHEAGAVTVGYVCRAHAREINQEKLDNNQDSVHLYREDHFK